ncbi:MAG TPA: ATP-binding cassette domain-containing protein [Candidatus Krumholzibacteria bacterium]|nr:ATP-binding cassette domain-containing protein [Candidatus Krumholzibacteria bacterium]HPD72535.1 ATP-binding cassette domain-containing protein [Candidatus Krumholzibacteria bacterium]HRY40533.1 ATP-binding cassette domain-containing protein [Candidatus Krumholzibacteria bacterium]
MTGRFALADVTVRYGSQTALRAVTLTIRAAERIALVGPSGAGKTTLLRLLNGSARATAGRVSADGRDLAGLARADLRRLRAAIGVVHQDLRLVDNLRVSQNVLAGGFGRQGFWGSVRAMVRPRRQDLARAHAILERVGIGEALFQRVDRLSGGQQQRVAIARALYQEPHVLLADEPVASVDPARARDTVALLTDVCRERELTLVMSLHNLDLAREFFPRLVGLREGAVIFDGPPAALGGESYRDLYRLPPLARSLDGT